MLSIVVLRTLNFAFFLILSACLYNDSKMFYSFCSHLVISIGCIFVNNYLVKLDNLRLKEELNQEYSDRETKSQQQQ